ncbi:GMC family oxidoreductase N-terminal domain-containing protein [Pseudomonas sp.]|jgi:choline dehydrogenase|uniref:GMC family oxidoreductase n=1 Tax=Pseudomonas sp. TaxID=306 RepID=UPI0028B03F1F|nr:GMC family oxidoreductase N-terminal domain-containing protein [Pseudomonas sp.]
MADYDYVIVGAGSAGCVLANRLSADPSLSVLLIEAGGSDWDPLVHVPLTFAQFLKSGHGNWNYVSEPEEDINGRTLPLPRGKLLGGTSSINGMTYARGNRTDYDGWQRLGAKGWSYADVLPYFKRAEGSWRGHGDFHGGDGPLGVSRPPQDNALSAALFEAAATAGFPVKDDIHELDTEGFAPTEFTIRNGKRCSTAVGYLAPVRSRHTLTVMTGALVSRVLIENGRATGVVFADDKQETIRARREVILCGGAYNSPQLLMLSGIGPRAELRRHGIAVIHASEDVGRHLAEPPSITMVFDTKPDLTFAKSLRVDRLAVAAVEWVVKGEGDMSSLPMHAWSFHRTEPEAPGADLQIMYSLTPPDSHIWVPGVNTRPHDAVSLMFSLLLPDSRGSVTLRSADPMDAPRITLNLLHAERDLARLVTGVKLARRVMSSAPVVELLTGEFQPGPDVQSDEDIADFIRKSVQTSYHPTGTCRMGSDDSAVVDSQLRVNGVAGLRVVDASVFPTPVGGNTNAPTIMVAERAADLILGNRPLHDTHVPAFEAAPATQETSHAS